MLEYKQEKKLQKKRIFFWGILKKFIHLHRQTMIKIINL